MRNKRNKVWNMLAIAGVLLSPAYFCSCVASRAVDKKREQQPQTDSADVFVPTHPPVVVPHSWQEQG